MTDQTVTSTESEMFDKFVFRGPHRLALLATLASAALGWSATTLATKPSGGGNGCTPTPAFTSFAGRAYVISADLVLLDTTHLSIGPIPDTGELPATGGIREASLLTLNHPPPLGVNLEVLSAATVGSGDRTVSRASVVNAEVNLNNQLIISAGVLESVAQARADCPDQTLFSGSSHIVNLTIEDKVNNKTYTFPVGAPANTTIPLPNLGKVVINEQYTDNGRFNVNAVHVTLDGGLSKLVVADVVISHAEAGGSGANCKCEQPECPVKDFMTGGGWITLPSGEKGTFGFVGGLKPNGLQGHLTYIDHGSRQKVKGTDVTAYSITGATSRDITYSATVNDAPDSCKLSVADNGEPGAGVDRFKIDCGGYDADGPTITHGNIQLHQPKCPAPASSKPGRRR